MLVKATIPFATADFNATAGEIFELEGEVLFDLISAGFVENAEEEKKAKSEKKATKKGAKK